MDGIGYCMGRMNDVVLEALGGGMDRRARGDIDR
jgi:hypothetical protein